MNHKIADLFDIKSRFLRSAHLERDFHDPGALAGYVPTEFIQSCLGRIGEGLRPRSGKSSFALALAADVLIEVANEKGAAEGERNKHRVTRAVAVKQRHRA